MRPQRRYEVREAGYLGVGDCSRRPVIMMELGVGGKMELAGVTARKEVVRSSVREIFSFDQAE